MFAKQNQIKLYVQIHQNIIIKHFNLNKILKNI
jgi:hypothetical protein